MVARRITSSRIGLFLTVLAGAFLLVSGCGGNANNSVPPFTAPIQATAVIAVPTQQPSYGSEGGPSGPPPEVAARPLTNAQQQRIILKNATLTLTVENPAQVISQVTQWVEGMGGWVVNSNVISEARGDRPIAHGTITVRVPADKFVTLMEQIKSSAVSVDNTTITGDDVTQKYVDLNSQLTNLQTTEAQLQKIMAGVVTVPDVLAVQAQLTTIHGQIEQIKGQLQYFSEAAAYSLIALTLNQKQAPYSTATPGPRPPFGLADWHPEQSALDALNALVMLVQSGITALIWLATFGIPVAIVLLASRFIGRRLLRRAQPPTHANAEE